MLYPVMGNSPLGTVGALQDTWITPDMLTATAHSKGQGVELLQKTWV